MPRYCVKRGQVFTPLAINAYVNKCMRMSKATRAFSAVHLFCYPHFNTVPLNSLQFKEYLYCIGLYGGFCEMNQM